MTPPFTPFDPPPSAEELPERFPSPFDEVGPHALARRAAEALQAALRSGHVAPGVSTAPLFEEAAGGKMFGVLAVRAPDGRLGFLRAFSGMFAGRWELEGFVPPLFDRDERTRLEAPGEAQVKRLVARAAEFKRTSGLAALRLEHKEQQQRHLAQSNELKGKHERRRQLRHVRRAELESDATLSEDTRREALHALDQESRGDKAERRRLEALQETERGQLLPRLARLERRRLAHERLRRWFCARLMQRLHDTYAVPNAKGEVRRLRALYPNGEPPSGAGDCAGPKLVAYALRHGFTPLALAELWWGAPPSSGGRLTGAFYGACRDKCAPLLPFMLEGLDVEPPRTFRPRTLDSAGLEVVYEDAWLVIIDKPEGLLSVPAKDASVSDSVLARLRARHPKATGPLLVHRLDLDTSGLLVAALDEESYVALQRQFISREVNKRYVALLDGEVRGEEGTIDLPIRVDLDDRPRQIHDPVHGRRAVTHWKVLGRAGGRTRVALFPHTGRTHQLRVHAAHPLGLGTPIVGDRLYGRAAERLLLHAEALTFRHPHDGRVLSFERPAPF